MKKFQAAGCGRLWEAQHWRGGRNYGQGFQKSRSSRKTWNCDPFNLRRGFETSTSPSLDWQPAPLQILNGYTGDPYFYQIVCEADDKNSQRICPSRPQQPTQTLTVDPIGPNRKLDHTTLLCDGMSVSDDIQVSKRKGLPIRPGVDHISGVIILPRMTVTPRSSRLIFIHVIDGIGPIQPKIVVIILAQPLGQIDV